MTVEHVQSIREAESKAEAMLRETRQKARQANKDAEAGAVKIMESVRADVEARAKKIIEEAEAAAREEAAPLVQSRREEISRLKTSARANLPKAVAMVTEKVVKFHADS